MVSKLNINNLPRKMKAQSILALFFSLGESQEHDGRSFFNFNGRIGVKHAISADEVDGEFCDSNSPLSLAGYFSGKWS